MCLLVRWNRFSRSLHRVIRFLCNFKRSCDRLLVHLRNRSLDFKRTSKPTLKIKTCVNNGHLHILCSILKACRCYCLWCLLNSWIWTGFWNRDKRHLSTDDRFYFNSNWSNLGSICNFVSLDYFRRLLIHSRALFHQHFRDSGRYFHSYENSFCSIVS